MLVDACSKLAEAVPLSAIDATRVAGTLINIFTRLGFPNEILTNNGSQFRARLMTEVFDVLQAHHIHISPYHPQSKGQVERFNCTLMSILQKLAAEKPEIWDKYIPTTHFAYWEVPH